jgi:putative hydrolase of the HAD superfamily
MTISTVLFDLDNTLYPATSGLMKGVDVRIGEYVQRLLGLDQAEARAVQKRYYAEFGTTLSGLQRNHAVDADDYLAYVHDLAPETFLAADAELDRLLGQLNATKAIFTNSPAEYARRVLAALGVEQHFAHVFDIRFARFRPKPDPQVYQLVLDMVGARGSDTILVEDSLPNLAPARALGMTTILVGEPVASPSSTIDYVVADVLEAIRVAIDLYVREQGRA